MKKAIFGTVIVLMLIASSCKKDNALLNAWTFKGVSYNADSASFNSTGGGAASANSPGSELVVYFPNGLPTTTTTFAVATGETSLLPSHVYIGLLTSAADYHSTGGSGNNQTVTVTVASGGKISISGSNIEVVNTTSASDSSSVTFNFNFTR